MGGHIDEGFHGNTRLDGLNWGLICHWPGPIAEGNGIQQVIVDERADEAQRDALVRIITGKDTEPFTTHFFVFNSTMKDVLEPVFTKIDLAIDVDKRIANVDFKDYATLKGRPILHDVEGEEHRVRIDLPNGFEYRIAEIGKGETKATGPIKLDLSNSYGQFCQLHMGNNGVIG